ncbi:MAG: HAMP domain-containing histidine kinase [Alphaproteobacteria bacterium]|nr:HAMP domain-containing histidine kinase [Alphaproteobacteria bacterium SS10]
MSRVKALLRLSAMRQTLWLLGLFSLITLVAWGGTYWLVQREMTLAVDTRLNERMEAAIAALDAGSGLPLPDTGETAAIVRTDQEDGFETVDMAPPGPEMRFLLQTTQHGRIRLGENTQRQEELRDILTAGMQVSLFGALLLSGLVGVWLARRGQARLNTISAGLAEVAQGRLNQRIVLDGQDDLSELADRINDTTARLDDAMTQMRVQSSNIAHDLRTPLARLRAQIETSLIAATERGHAVEPAELEAALEQIDQISGTFEALLRLARIESGAGREAFAPVDLGELADDIAQTFGPVIEDTGHALTVDRHQPASVNGDRALLVQLLANLVQNALRHGAEGQAIVLQVQGAMLTISDQGVGIPAGEREKVLQPLYQGEASRQGEGAGLGLSLVRAIAELHDAELTLSDGPGGRGLTVSVRFKPLTEM